MPDLTPPGASRRRRVLRSALALGLAVAATSSAVTALPAMAAGHKVILRALVVSAGDPATLALATELDREGIPFTTVPLWAADRPTIDAAFLADAGTGTGRFQAVFLPNQAGGGLAPAELDALASYEAGYGVRQVNGYDYPGASMGLDTPTYAGPLDGAAVTVTAAGLAGPFGYLTGQLTVDDVDPAVLETYGYLAAPSSTLPAGQSFTPLLTATAGSASGVLAGVYAHDGREELVLPASFNQYMQWFNEVGPGIVSWATRGIHLGLQRNYFGVQVDDVFLPDSRWSITGHCTPGDGCVDPGVTTTDIRMTAADVSRLVNWQQAHGYSLDLAFNGGGSELAKAATGSDPLTDAFLAEQARFAWINHTYSHQYLGCIQIAPTVAGQSWHCATSATETPRQDDEIAGETSGGLYWAATSALTSQVGDNISWARAHGLTSFDPAELVTGEHSGLVTLPQQATDNPFLAPVLASLGVRYTASDASRETAPRALAGGATVTVPRHPMNIFYNAGSYADEVSEYNWIYTSAADGGSGICTDNPSSTCITPLPASTPAQAQTSFEGYIKPIEVRNALRYVLTNDPRPFYAHQSNLAEDGILYPVVQGVLDAYASVYDTAKAPLQHLGLTGQYQAIKRLDDWRAANASVDGYLDSTGVHVPAASVPVPVTVPAGSSGGSLQAYAGSLSGWVEAGAGATLVPPTPAGGYLVQAPVTVPGAPAIGVAEPGSTTATVRWTAPAADGNSPLTGFVVRGYAGTSTTPSLTVSAAADATSLVVTGLTNGTAYRFDVAAVNLAGTGPASALSNPVTPKLALAPVPTNVTAGAGNAAVTVTWAAPSNTAGVTGYRVRAFTGSSTTVARSVTVAAGRLGTTLTGLVNGTGYTVDVSSLYGSSAGPASVRSATVTPALTAQADGAPSIASLVPGGASVTVSWSPPVDASAGTPTGYRVRAYLGTSTVAARSVSVSGTATSAAVTGLVNGSGYTFDVTVLYATGTGAASVRSAAVIPVATVPGAPVIGSASSGVAGGTVTATARWSAPSSTGGSPIVGYRVIASALAANETVTGTTTSVLLSASARSLSMVLPVKGQIRFTVVAVNAVGDGPESAPSGVVTAQ